MNFKIYLQLKGSKVKQAHQFFIMIYNQIQMIRIGLLITFCLISSCLHLESEIHEENLIQSEEFQSLRQAELEKHNFYREKHGCDPLVLNQSLNNIAQNYSEYQATQLKAISHSQPAKQGNYGENLFWAWGSPTQPYADGDASDSWYSQQSQYTYGVFPPPEGTGHFTAMIWKSVTSVGFGYYKVQENGGEAIYVVANYYPTPNVYTEEQYTLNVPNPNQNSFSQSNNTKNQSIIVSNQTSQQPTAFAQEGNDNLQPFEQQNGAYKPFYQASKNISNNTEDTNDTNDSNSTNFSNQTNDNENITSDKNEINTNDTQSQTPGNESNQPSQQASLNNPTLQSAGWSFITTQDSDSNTTQVDESSKKASQQLLDQLNEEELQEQQEYKNEVSSTLKDQELLDQGKDNQLGQQNGAQQPSSN